MSQGHKCSTPIHELWPLVLKSLTMPSRGHKSSNPLHAPCLQSSTPLHAHGLYVVKPSPCPIDTCPPNVSMPMASSPPTLSMPKSHMSSNLIHAPWPHVLNTSPTSWKRFHNPCLCVAATVKLSDAFALSFRRSHQHPPAFARSAPPTRICTFTGDVNRCKSVSKIRCKAALFLAATPMQLAGHAKSSNDQKSQPLYVRR